MRIKLRLALLSTLSFMVLPHTFAQPGTPAKKPTSYVFFVVKEKKAEVFYYQSEGKVIVHKQCELPLKETIVDEPTCLTVRSIAASEYDTLLKNQMGLAAIVPARNRLNSISQDLTRLNLRLLNDPQLGDDLGPKIKELTEEQKVIADKFDKLIEANLKAIKLYDKITLHLGFPLKDKPAPTPLGLRFEPEENLKSYQPLTEFPKKKVIEAILFPMVSHSIKNDFKAPEKEFIDQRSSVVAITPSKLEEGYAHLRILMQDDGKPMGSEFSFFNLQNKVLGKNLISTPFVPAVGPKVMVEIEKNHFLIVGQDQSKKGAQGMVQHVSWNNGQWKQQALVLEGIPRIQSITQTLEKTFLLTAIDTKNVWLVEIDEKGEKILKSKNVFTTNALEREEELEKDLILDATAITLTDGQVVLSLGLTTEFIQEYRSGVYFAQMLYLSSDWKKTNVTVSSHPQHYQRYWDLTALPDGKLGLITEKAEKMTREKVREHRTYIGAVLKTLEIYDSQGNRENYFATAGSDYGRNGQFGNIVYNSVSKEILATVEMAKTGEENLYIFTSKGSFIGTDSLSWDKIDLRAIAPIPGSGEYIAVANTIEQKEVWEAQRFSPPQKTYKPSLATARWTYKTGTPISPLKR